MSKARRSNYCTAADKSVRIASILEAIPPFWAKESMSTLEMCPSQETGNSLCKGCLTALLEILRVFDAVTTSSKRGRVAVKAKSEASYYFLRSLARYVRMNYKLVPFSHEERKVVNTEATATDAFMFGTQFVYTMEDKRVNLFNDDTPIRNVQVAIAIVKSKVRGIQENMYLVHWDDEACRYQWVGGKFRPDLDADLNQAIRREIDEELRGNSFKFGKDYELKELFHGMKIRDLSQSLGAYSEYEVTAYHMRFLKNCQIRLHRNRWVTASELSERTTKDGEPISVQDLDKMNRAIDGGFDGLAVSLGEHQESMKDKMEKLYTYKELGIRGWLKGGKPP